MKFYLARSWFLCLLGEALGAAGEVDEALTTMDEALELNPSEMVYRPSVFRMRGELRLRRRPTGTDLFELAERDFHEAIHVAHQMAAKSDELRATSSLARLQAKTGRRDEAYTMLADVYGTSSEGFDTADLRDAKTLLDELCA
jgi:tetratricopeptide (TPR) repeat protein